MKITKSELKLIVKECLVEILSEGLGDLGLQTNVQSYPARPALPLNRQIQRPIGNQIPAAGTSLASSQLRQPLKSESANASQNLQLTPRRPPPAIKESIKREAGGNKIMESILADTAMSTLPKMIQNEGRQQQIPSTAAGGVAEHIVASANPEDIFGDEAASKWASLAFADSPIKK
jgi:hypothetical protein